MSWTSQISAAGLAFAMAAGTLAGQTRVGAVAVQDRSEASIATERFDAELTSALRRAGLDPVPLTFAPPADVDHFARVAGCEYILYTDIARIERTPGSRFARAVRRMIGGAPRNPGTYEAEVEFRLFRLNEPYPLVSTTVSGRSSGRELQPHVEAHIVHLELPGAAAPESADSAPAAVSGGEAVQEAAIRSAIHRQVRAIQAAVARPRDVLD